MANRIPVEEWFKDEAGKQCLLGTKCKKCGTYYFPNVEFCRNPNCMSPDFDTVELSTEGTLWSYSTNHYAPPEPYHAPDPYVPYTLCVVTLEKEQMSIVGTLADGYTDDQIKAGTKMELVIEPLWVDDEGEHTIWKWKPVL